MPRFPNYKTRVNLSIDPETLKEIDRAVLSGEFRTRSEAIEAYVQEGLDAEPDDDDEDEDDGDGSDDDDSDDDDDGEA